MKMRNWLKTTLAAGLVAATGAAMIGCGCDTEISYKDAMTAYHEVITINDDIPTPTQDFLKAAKDGFTLSYTKTTNSNYGTDGKPANTETVTYKVESITGVNGISKVTKTKGETTTVVTLGKTKVNAEASDESKAYYFYDGNNKLILSNGAQVDGVTINKDPIDFATAYQTNILGGIFGTEANIELLLGTTELLAEGSEFAGKDDPVAEYNKKYNKDLSAENTTKKELKSKFLKTGDNSYKLTLSVVESTWKGADKKADEKSIEVTYEIKDKAVTKLTAKSTTSVEGSKTADATYEATFDYKKPTLTAAPNLNGAYEETQIAGFVEFLAQFPNATVQTPADGDEE